MFDNFPVDKFPNSQEFVFGRIGLFLIKNFISLQTFSIGFKSGELAD